MASKKQIHKIILLIVFFLILVIAVLFALFNGSVSYSPKQILEVLFSSNADAKTRNIIMDIRLPRVSIAVLVGACLAMSGAYMQAVMGNPMADPGIIGVSSGSVLAAVVIMLIFPQMFHLLPIASFLGGCVACVIVFALSWRNGTNPIRLILSGVAVNALLGGGIALLSLLYSDRIMGVLLWTNGSLSALSMTDFWQMLPTALLGFVFAGICIPFANVLILGDDTAKSLGIPVQAARLCLSAVSAYLTAIAVSRVGLVGYIGLIIPHIARMLVGSDYRITIPFSAICGALILVVADTVARTAFSPTEIPVGVVMSMIGGPFFIWLFRKKVQL